MGERVQRDAVFTRRIEGFPGIESGDDQAQRVRRAQRGDLRLQFDLFVAALSQRWRNLWMCYDLGAE